MGYGRDELYDQLTNELGGYGIGPCREKEGQISCLDIWMRKLLKARMLANSLIGYFQNDVDKDDKIGLMNFPASWIRVDLIHSILVGFLDDEVELDK